MGYYHIQVSAYASKFCMIIITWGKYCYKHLPMRVSNSLEKFPTENERFPLGI